MALVNIVDESRLERRATVFANNSLKSESRFAYVGVASGTATGSILTNGGVLHSVIIGGSAAGGKFWLFDSAGTAGAIGASASAVARLETATRGHFIFDAILGAGLQFRLSAADCDGITVVYATD